MSIQFLLKNNCNSSLTLILFSSMKFHLLLSLLLLSRICLSDVHTFAIIGDAGVWNQTTKDIRNSIQKSNIKNLILPGDNIYDLELNYEDIWNKWSTHGFEFSVVAIGNHTKGYNEEMLYFKLPSEFYTKVMGPIRFIVLNSDNVDTAQEQASYLNQQLALAKEQFIFVVYHHPPFTLRHSWQERRNFHLTTRPILKKYNSKITALIVGHDHVASAVEFNTIPVIVAGAVWESFKIPPINYREQDFIAKTLWTSQGGFYWVRLDADTEKNQAWINFVEVTDSKKKVRCSIKIAPRPMIVSDNCYSKTRRDLLQHF